VSLEPFAGLLLGQPTLRRRIKLGSFAALDQRIMLRYALPGMTRSRPATTSATISSSLGAATSYSATTPPR